MRSGRRCCGRGRRRAAWNGGRGERGGAGAGGGLENGAGTGDGQADGGGAGVPLLELPPACDPAPHDARYVRPPPPMRHCGLRARRGARGARRRGGARGGGAAAAAAFARARRAAAALAAAAWSPYLIPYGRMPLVYSHNKTVQHPNEKITHIVYLSKKWRHAGSTERSYRPTQPLSDTLLGFTRPHHAPTVTVTPI